MPDLASQVADNQRDVERANARFVRIPPRANRNLSFIRNLIEVQVGVEIYTRPLNDALISGHPNGGTHGSANGVSGDVRGDWSLVTSTTQSEVWAVGGRDAVVDALDGQTNTLDTLAVGTDGTTATVSNRALGARTGDALVVATRSGNEATARAEFRFADDGLGTTPLREVGVLDASGRLLARATLSDQQVTQEQELRVDISQTVVGAAGGDGVITDVGETAIAESIAAEDAAVGLEEIALGTGSTTPQPSDTALDSEEYRNLARRDVGPESVELEMRTTASQPSSQPVDLSEVGVFTNTGEMVYRSTYQQEEKTDDFGFTTFIGFRVV